MSQKKLSPLDDAVKKDMRKMIGYDARSRISPIQFAAEVDAGIRNPLPPKGNKKKK